MTTNAELIVNANSRRSKSAMRDIEASCEKHGIKLIRTHVVTASSSLVDALTDIVKRRPRLVIVGGGDGTISDVVDYIAGTPIQLGIIPLGTTNNFARSLGIPLDIDSAIELISGTKAKSVDLGWVRDEYFTNVIGVGISAKVAHHITDQQKKRFGRLAYAITGVVELIKHKPFHVTLQDKDSELQINFETHQVIIANGRYHAGKMIAQEAEVDNRELIIFAIGGRSKFSFIWHMIDFYVGSRKSVRHASYFIGKDIRLTTSTEQLVELDGEVKFTTPLTVRVEPDALNVRY